MKNFPAIFNFLLAISALYILASIIYFISGSAYGAYVLLSAIIPLIFLIMRGTEVRKFVDRKIDSVIGNLKDYSVYSKSLPGYRFVDIYNAVSLLSSQSPSWVQMESQHPESLAQILNLEFFTEANRRIKITERVARPIKEHEEGFFPVDSFWLRAPSAINFGGVVRVRVQVYTHEVVLEVGTKEQEHAEGIIKEVLQLASSNSIFQE